MRKVEKCRKRSMMFSDLVGMYLRWAVEKHRMKHWPVTDVKRRKAWVALVSFVKRDRDYSLFSSCLVKRRRPMTWTCETSI
jgi:hypothetical protein